MDRLPGKSGYEAIEEYGWGDKDPVTGIYEGYDVPKGVLNAGHAVSFTEILQAWGLLEYTFHAVLGIDLEAVWRVKSWRWFTVRVKHLLSQDTPLAHYFAPDDDPKPEVPDE